MAQGDLPRIHGSGWKPSAPLTFVAPLVADAARAELLRFIAERHEGLLPVAVDAWASSVDGADVFDGPAWHAFSETFVEAFAVRAAEQAGHLEGVDAAEEIIPRRNADLHLGRRLTRVLIDLRLTLRRLAHYMAVTLEHRMEWQRMMTRTRALDEALKVLFTERREAPDGTRFGGKGFRSTWQEAIVAAATPLVRQPDAPLDARPGAGYEGDLVAPMIRDVGLALAMGDTPLGVMAANLGKAGSVMDGGQGSDAGGRDLHIGAWHVGVLPPTAPLPIAACTMTGLAFAAMRQGLDRFHVACIGEGASSSGEFWEAMNLAGARGLPITYVLQNNQIALDTPPAHQSGVELWADKAVAMGFPGWTIDGSDPAAIHASVAVAREYGLEGGGPTLIHIETMRGCGHAHHHDDLYLGSPSGTTQGYVDEALIEYWEAKDPVPTHRALLLDLGVESADLNAMEDEEETAVDVALAELDDMPWPTPSTVTKGLTTLHDAEPHARHLERLNGADLMQAPPASPLEPGQLAWTYAEQGGWTYARAIQQAMADVATREGDNTVFIGEDMEVAGAFGLNMGLRNAGHQDLLVDMPLCEAAIIHTAVGAALSGMRPMAEIQFGGFAALAHNALVNNAAMLRWRWGADCPMTVRVPLGARTRSGPYHANMIESWYANDPGLIVLAPSTPQQAYDMIMEASALPDPVLILEHIGLYGLRGGKTGWEMNINQHVDTEPVNAAVASGQQHSIGKSTVIRGGGDVTLVTWGAMVHLALEAASTLASEGVEVEVIDVGTLMPFDAQPCVDSVLRTGRLVVLHEAQWSGGLGHTIQSRIMESAFYALEAAPVVVGALDTPVPFSPPLENHTIPDVAHVEAVLRTVCQD
ncbi:MAG: thiamine pyrophosphate-dependent enzyme [Candidatus Poseidoniaceae archaeon]|nr:thiamine pyrophosphate-dependent enzyme [Candidatus Poseidoniaceae archaeon]